MVQTAGKRYSKVEGARASSTLEAVQPRYFTVKGMVRSCFNDPAEAITVTLKLPLLPFLALLRVSVEEPFCEGTLCGLKLAVIPAGNPEAENSTVELSPPRAAVVITTVPPAVELTVMLVTLGVSENPGTFTVMVCLCVRLPPVAVTVAL